MGSFLATLCQAAFGLMLAGNMVMAAVLTKLLSFLPLSKRTRGGITLMLVQAAWRWTLMLSPWVSCEKHASSADWPAIIAGTDDQVDNPIVAGEKIKRPLFLVGNHTSFFDTLYVVIALPSSVLWNVRTYMKAELFDMPILGLLSRSIGHFGVHFTSSEEGKFKVDAEKMAVVDEGVNAHLSSGGWLSFFAEGQVNKNPDQLMPFRYGGFKKVLDFDGNLVSFVTRGNPSIWPAKAAVGGFPGRMMYSLKVLAPNGAKALLAELRKKAEASPEESEKSDQQLMAEAVQAMCQAQYDELKVLMDGNDKGKRD